MFQSRRRKCPGGGGIFKSRPWAVGCVEAFDLTERQCLVVVAPCVLAVSLKSEPKWLICTDSTLIDATITAVQT